MKAQNTHTFRLSDEDKRWLVEFAAKNATTPGILMRLLLRYLQHQSRIKGARSINELIFR